METEETFEAEHTGVFSCYIPDGDDLADNRKEVLAAYNPLSSGARRPA